MAQTAPAQSPAPAPTRAPGPSSNAAKLAKIRAIGKSSQFAKQIFAAGNSSLSTLQVGQGLKQILIAAGIDVPQELKIGLDVAQMIMAGGTFVESVQTGSSIAQCANPLAGTISGVANLLGDLGLLDPDAQKWANFGTSSCMVISSGGLNIAADIAFILSFISVFGDFKTALFGSYETARQEAKKALAQVIKRELGPQAIAAQKFIDQYNAGELNPFDLIGNIALQSPAFLKDVFPQIAAYLPSVKYGHIVSGYSRGLFSSETYSEKFEWIEAIVKKPELQAAIIDSFFVRPTLGFSRDQWPGNQISLKALSTLSMLLSASSTGKVMPIGLDFPVLAAMKYLGVTPAMLGDDWLFNGDLSHMELTSDMIFPYKPLTLPMPRLPSNMGLVINGVATLSKTDKANKAYWESLVRFQMALRDADRAGDMDTLLSQVEASAMLAQWARIQILPSWLPDSREPVGMYPKNMFVVPISKQSWFNFDKMLEISSNQRLNPAENRARGAPQVDFPKNVMDYIRANYTFDLSDYWKSLGTLSTMRKSNVLSDQATKLAPFGSIEAIESQFQSSQQFIIAKQMNYMAQLNIADYLGIPIEKLGRRVDELGNVVFFELKG